MVNINSNSQRFQIRQAIRVGDTADIHLSRAIAILRNENVNPTVTMELSPQRSGVLCGIDETLELLDSVLPGAGSEVWSLEEGERVSAGEVALRIRAAFATFGVYETAICGILSSCTAWATAARECVDAAADVPVIAMPARHVHPNIAATIDYAAIKGGCTSCTTIVGARLAGVTPEGDMPHSLPLLLGDTVRAIHSFHRYLPQGVPRVALVDTFKDEAEEALNVGQALRDDLRGIRLDTPNERGGVSVELVREVRARLDQEGLRHVEIAVSGGFDPERIQEFVKAGPLVDRFLVGAYISDAPPNNFTADIHEIEGRAIAKRGRIPGVTANPRLDRRI